MTRAEYKGFKELDRPTDNLRDHMTDLELIFTMLSEASTTEIARNMFQIILLGNDNLIFTPKSLIWNRFSFWINFGT